MSRLPHLGWSSHVYPLEAGETLYRSGVRLLGTRGKPPFTTFAVADEENQ